MLHIDDFPERCRIKDSPIESMNSVDYENQRCFKPNGLWYGLKDSWYNNSMGGEYKEFIDLNKNFLYELVFDETMLEEDETSDIFLDIDEETDFKNIPKNKILRITDKNVNVMFLYIAYIIKTIKLDINKNKSSIVIYPNCVKTVKSVKYKIPKSPHSLWSYVAQDFIGVEFCSTELYYINYEYPGHFRRKYGDKFKWIKTFLDTLYSSLDADSGCIWDVSMIKELKLVNCEGVKEELLTQE